MMNLLNLDLCERLVTSTAAAQALPVAHQLESVSFAVRDEQSAHPFA
ncbi:MAG: hypothetical protein CM1200mP41_07720 [Gammaproteobacteria bacterium]|nr:MAG: hypothetical protein CM1200mP41_07720 [Gammaproteobacteria bacterium]